MAFCLLLPSSASWAEKLENDHFRIEYADGNIRIQGKRDLKLSVRQLQVAGTPVDCFLDRGADPMWGEARRMNVVCDNGNRISLSLYPQNPFIYVHTTIANKSQEIFRAKQMEFYTVWIDADEGTQANALGTGGLHTIDTATGSFTYSLLADPESRNAVLISWLTQMRGLGHCTPGIGDAGIPVGMGLDFGNYVVAPGTERDTDIAIIGEFEDGREALELYGDYLARVYRVELPRKPNVYCTWYHRNMTGSGASTEALLRENAAFAERALRPFGLSVMQIDDHWQSSMIEGVSYRNVKEKTVPVRLGRGPLKTFAESNFNYPSGMAACAENLNHEGFVAGLWFMPFSGDVRNPRFEKEIFAKRADNGMPFECKSWSGTCIDATSPAGETFLRHRFKRLYDWGFRYFKIDGLHTGAPSENIYTARDMDATQTYRGESNYANAVLHNDTMTFVQCFRRGMTILREETPGAFLMGCCIAQNMSSCAPAFGLCDGMRIGPDNDKARFGEWRCVTAGAKYAAALYFLNGRVWYNDCDAYYVRESNTLNRARWMVSWQSISGSVSTTSIQYSELPDERLDLIRRGLPVHDCKARPADVLRNPQPQIWTVSDERMCLLGLFNWQETAPVSIACNPEELGLETETAYELFDFWENKYLGSVKGPWNVDLDAASCRVLAVRKARPYPQVISTSRHITQGIVDIEHERWDAAGMLLHVDCRCVEGDPYELRIIVPDGFRIIRATCGSYVVSRCNDGRLVRLCCTPERTGTETWNIGFARIDR